MSVEEIYKTMSALVAEQVMSMEDEFEVGEIQEEELGSLKTVGDAVNYIAGKLK